MLADECGRTEKPRFLAVGEQRDDIVLERRSGAERAECLEQHRYSGAVVTCGRAGRNAVRVGHQEHRGSARFGTWQTRDHVVNSPRNLIPGTDAGRLLNLSRHTECGELCKNIGANAGRIRTADRVRPLRHHPHVAERPFGGEDGCGGVSRDWRWWTARTDH